MTQHFMVIGNPIAHSKSPQIHQHFARQAQLDIAYQRQYCPDDPASFTAAIEAFFHGGGVGANVTVPFKQMAYDYCHAHGGLSTHAKVAGAVNTLLLNPDTASEGAAITDIIYGDNTDGQGLIHHMQRLGWPITGTRVAILGAGGAARGVILPLLEANISSLTIANRTLPNAHEVVATLSKASPLIARADIEVVALDELTGEFDIIINATSIGLTTATLPLADSLQTRYAYDMMYGRTLPFLTHFLQQGADVSDGFGMLIHQAALSFTRWTGHTVSAEDTLCAIAGT